MSVLKSSKPLLAFFAGLGFWSLRVLLPKGGSLQMLRLGLRVELDWALYHPRSTEMFPFLCLDLDRLWSGGQQAI